MTEGGGLVLNSLPALAVILAPALIFNNSILGVFDYHLSRSSRDQGLIVSVL